MGLYERWREEIRIINARISAEPNNSRSYERLIALQGLTGNWRGASASIEALNELDAGEASRLLRRGTVFTVGLLMVGTAALVAHVFSARSTDPLDEP